MRVWKKQRKDLVALDKMLKIFDEQYKSDFILLYETFFDFIFCDWKNETIFKHRKQSLLSLITNMKKFSKSVKEVDISKFNDVLKLVGRCQIISSKENMPIQEFYDNIKILENFTEYVDIDSVSLRL